MEQEKHVKDYLQIEDRAMKVAAMYFGQELLRTLGIKGEIRRAGPTELAHGVQVRTVVLCTAATKVESRRLARASGTYEVQVVSIRNQNGDRLIERTQKREKKGKTLKREDISPLLLTPLMSGSSSPGERICQVMDWAMKLLNREELESIKERWKMSLLGQMLVDMGEEQGIKIGIERGVKQGVKRGVRQGESLGLIRLTIRKYHLGQSKEEITRDLLEEPERIEEICRIAKKHPDYDEARIMTRRRYTPC